MRATATPVDNNHVQLLIEVDEEEIAKAMDDAARRIAREVSIKGFRKGKAPRRVIEAHIGGAGQLRAEALRGSINGFYARGVSEAAIEPIDQPDMDIKSGEEEGPLVLEASVEVRPEVLIAGYDALRVTIPSPMVFDDEVEAQIDRLRETDAELKDVERPLLSGDQIVVDVSAVDPAGDLENVELSDFAYRAGADAVAQGIDEILLGHKVGDVVEAMGRIKKEDEERGEFRLYTVTIKRISEVVLPELSDEWVSENTDFATIDALREGVLNQLRRMKVMEAQFAQRDAMLAAVSELVSVDEAPETLITSELQYRASEFSRRLGERGISPDYYLQVTGQTSEELVSALREDAVRAVRVDLALRALVRAEALEATDDEIETELVETAESMNVKADALRQSLFDNGRTVGFAIEVAKMKASRWLMEHVIYVDPSGAEIDRSLLEPESPSEEGDAVDYATEIDVADDAEVNVEE
jgi:trigger factor